jgi:hypothetical protein
MREKRNKLVGGSYLDIKDKAFGLMSTIFFKDFFIRKLKT